LGAGLVPKLPASALPWVLNAYSVSLVVHGMLAAWPAGINIEYKEVAKADAGRPNAGIGRNSLVRCILSGSAVHRGCVIGLTDRAWRPVINRNQEVPASKFPELARIIKALTIDMNLITRCHDLHRGS
jgi:hypothetical protein